MNAKNTGQLLTLGAIWGASFLFARVGAPEFGAVALAGMRVLVAALFLLPVLVMKGQWQDMWKHWKPIAIVGILNSALPFLCFAFAALHINAGMSAMFNATTPMWGALIAWLWLGDRLTFERVLGLSIGFMGVAWLAWDKASVKDGSDTTFALLAMGACVAASTLYGLASSFTKKYLADAPAMAVATGSQVSASVALLLPMIWAWPEHMPNTHAWVSTLMLGLLCTGVAYALFFKLLAQIGPANAMTVTYLIPAFAIVWGYVFLSEAVTLGMAIGGAIVLTGTALATGLLSSTWRRWRGAAS